MNFRPVSGSCFLLSVVLFLGVLSPGSVCGQEVKPGVREAYFRIVAKHFGVPAGEVSILGDWDLEPDEVPVVLFLSRRAGVSPDALIGLRRGGLSWSAVASRFGLGVQSFHLPLPEDAPLGSLSRAYTEFRGRPAREWNSIELEDAEIVTLVNLRILPKHLGLPPLGLLRIREERGNFLAAFASLRR